MNENKVEPRVLTHDELLHYNGIVWCESRTVFKNGGWDINAIMQECMVRDGELSIRSEPHYFVPIDELEYLGVYGDYCWQERYWTDNASLEQRRNTQWEFPFAKYALLKC